jgi:hypothetical protein
MRIGKINSPSSRLTTPATPDFEPQVVKDVAGRALLVIEAQPAATEAAANFRQAPFLAQLIATRDQHPQTRDRRRTDPTAAIVAYRAVDALLHHQD